MSPKKQWNKPFPSLNFFQTMTSKLFLRTWTIEAARFINCWQQPSEQGSAEQQRRSERGDLMLRNNRCSTSSKSGRSCRKLPTTHLSAASPKVTNDELQKAARVALGSLSPSSVPCPAELAWQHQRLNTTPVGGQAGSREGFGPTLRH